MAKAMFTGVEAIMSGWDTFIKRDSYYLLLTGTIPVWQSGGTPTDRDELQDMLTAFEQSNNTDILFLRFYPDGTKTPVTKNTEYVSSMIVQVLEAQKGSRAVGAVNDNRLPYDVYQTLQAMNKQSEAITKLTERIELMESEEVEDAGIMGKIETFVSGPIGKLLLDCLMPASVGRLPNIAVNGSPIAENSGEIHGDVLLTLTPEQDAELNKVLDRLAPKLHIINDLNRLATLAETDPGMFKFMLDELRKRVTL